MTITLNNTFIRPQRSVRSAVRRAPVTHAEVHADIRSELRLVSATSMSVDAEVRGMIRPSVPNYALRRVLAGVAAAAAVCVLFVSAIGLLASFGSAPASASGVSPALTATAQAVPTVHVAQPGDTLWSIASTYHGAVGHAAYLDALVRNNGGPSVTAGQAIWLP